MISLRALTRRFPRSERAALDKLTLQVAEGELLVLVGPSGCGKSTALRLIAGLDAPDEGVIEIGGRDVSRVAPQDRDVAMVFQGYALYPHMTARQIMAFPLKMRGMSALEQSQRVERTATMLGLGGLLDRRPSELSGGERQRVAMGRAIVREPKVFLFDEPLSNLDAALRAELRVDLAALVRRLGTTSIYVTHDQVEAMTMGDRIAVLRQGELQQVGTPRTIYEDPVNVFVASFLGTPAINVVELLKQDGVYKKGPISMTVPDGWVFPSKVVAAIRPEHLHIVDKAQGERKGDEGLNQANAVRFDMRVTVVEPLGSETLLYLDAEEIRLRARVAGFQSLPLKESVRVVVDQGRILWFDAETGKRIRGNRE